MPIMIVKHRVANFKVWKQVFDELEKSRREHGWIAHEVYQDAADPNQVVIINRMKNLDLAREYGGSEELRAAMQRAGVEGPPEIFFLNDTEMKHY